MTAKKVLPRRIDPEMASCERKKMNCRQTQYKHFGVTFGRGGKKQEHAIPRRPKTLRARERTKVQLKSGKRIKSEGKGIRKKSAGNNRR